MATEGALSQDNLPRLADGTVDIDRIDLRLLFVCSNKQAIGSVGSFLKRRGWETAIVTKINDAFKLIATFKPDFVLLSVNFKSPKINQLPLVLKNTFKVNVVTFSETSDTKTLQLFQKIPADYKVQGSISGPSLQRRMRQILQEIYKVGGDSRKPATANENNDSGESAMNRNRGSAEEKDKQSEMMRFSKDPAVSAKSRFMLGTEKSDESGLNSEELQKNAEDQIKDPDQIKDLERLAKEFEADVSSSTEEGIEGEAPNDDGVDNIENLNDISSKNSSNRSLAIDRNEKSTSDEDLFSLNKGHKNNTSAAGFDLDKSDESPGHPASSKQKASFSLKQENSRPYTDSKNSSDLGAMNPSITNTPGLNLNEPVSTQKSQEAQNKESSTADNKIFDSNNVSNSPLSKKTEQEIKLEDWFTLLSQIVFECLPDDDVPMATENGFVKFSIVTMNCGGQIFGLLVTTSLVPAYQAMFETRLQSQTIEIGRRRFSEFEITDASYAFIQKEHCSKSIDGQLGQTLIKKRKATADIRLVSFTNEESKFKFKEQSGKLQLDIKMLQPQTPTGVSLYLYLPLNNRFYKYTQANSCLQGKQIEKLSAENTNLYVDAEDLDVIKGTLRRMEIVKKFNSNNDTDSLSGNNNSEKNKAS